MANEFQEIDQFSEMTIISQTLFLIPPLIPERSKSYYDTKQSIFNVLISIYSLFRQGPQSVTYSSQVFPSIGGGGIW
jgi:hypothetical protein